jgi:hypothetical protein
MRSEDLFPAGADAMDIDGARVRKGTVAAFAHNALTLERPDITGEERAQALADLRAAVPVLRAAGMFEVFCVRQPTAARIVEETAPVRGE